MWRVQDRDIVTEMNYFIKKMVVPAIIVEQSDSRLIAVNSAAQIQIPKGIQYLPDLFETRLVKFGPVSTLLIEDGQCEICAINVASDDTTMAVIFAACPQNSTDDLTNDKSFYKMPMPLLKLVINGDLLMANEAALRLLDINSVENLNLRDLMDGLSQFFTEWLNRSAFGVHYASSEFLRLKRGETETFLQVTLSRIVEKTGRSCLLF